MFVISLIIIDYELTLIYMHISSYLQICLEKKP